MDCSELNFVSSQALYGTMIAYPEMPETEQIEKAIRMAKQIIKKNEPKKEYATFGKPGSFIAGDGQQQLVERSE